MVRETRHLWVANLPDNTREDRIREHFQRYGRVQSVKIIISPGTITAVDPSSSQSSPTGTITSTTELSANVLAHQHSSGDHHLSSTHTGNNNKCSLQHQQPPLPTAVVVPSTIVGSTLEPSIGVTSCSNVSNNNVTSSNHNCITMCAATIAFMDIKSASKAHLAEHKFEDRILTTEYYEPSVMHHGSAESGGSLVINSKMCSEGTASGGGDVRATTPHGRFASTSSHGSSDDHSPGRTNFYERVSTSQSGNRNSETTTEFIRRNNYHANDIRGRQRDRHFRNNPYSLIVDRTNPISHHRLATNTSWYETSPSSSSSRNHYNSNTTNSNSVFQQPDSSSYDRHNPSDLIDTTSPNAVTTSNSNTIKDTKALLATQNQTLISNSEQPIIAAPYKSKLLINNHHHNLKTIKSRSGSESPISGRSSRSHSRSPSSCSSASSHTTTPTSSHSSPASGGAGEIVTHSTPSSHHRNNINKSNSTGKASAGSSNNQRHRRNLQATLANVPIPNSIDKPASTTSSLSSSGSVSGSNPVVHSEDNRPLAICVKNLPLRSSDTSLKDGLFHEYKKHGKVTWVKVVGQSHERYALVCFKKPEDVEKALEVSQDKLFFGCKIEVQPYQGYDVDDNEFRPYEAEIDEYQSKSTRTLFIGNLEKHVTVAELRKAFEVFGEILEIDIKKQGSSPYAFCQYADIVSVVKAVRKMDGEHFGSTRIKLGFGKSMPTTCVWLDGILDGVSEHYLTQQFSRFGTVQKVAIDRDRKTALVSFDQIQCAQQAVKETRGTAIRGRKLQVDYASRECVDAFYARLEKLGVQPANINVESLITPGNNMVRHTFNTSRSRASSFSRPGNPVSGATSPTSTPSAGSTPRHLSSSGSVGKKFRYAAAGSPEFYDSNEYLDAYGNNFDQERVVAGDSDHLNDGETLTITSSSVRRRCDKSPGDIRQVQRVDSESGISGITSSIRRRCDRSPVVGEMRILESQRHKILDQLEKCPSSGDETETPRKRAKYSQELVTEDAHNNHHNNHDSSATNINGKVLDHRDSSSTASFSHNHHRYNHTDLVHRKTVEIRRLSDCNIKHSASVPGGAMTSSVNYTKPNRRPSTDSLTRYQSMDSYQLMMHKRRKTSATASTSSSSSTMTLIDSDQLASKSRSNPLNVNNSFEASGGESEHGSRPGTPLFDERPENSIDPRRPPIAGRPVEPMSLPLPKFAQQFHQQLRQSNQLLPAAHATAPAEKHEASNGTSTHLHHSSLKNRSISPTPQTSQVRSRSNSLMPPVSSGSSNSETAMTSPRPPSLVSNSSDSEHELGSISGPNASPSLEERLKKFTEDYDSWSSNGRSSSSSHYMNSFRHAVPEIAVPETPELLKNVLKNSMFDEDSKRLENIDKFMAQSTSSALPTATVTSKNAFGTFGGSHLSLSGTSSPMLSMMNSVPSLGLVPSHPEGLTATSALSNSLGKLHMPTQQPVTITTMIHQRLGSSGTGSPLNSPNTASPYNSPNPSSASSISSIKGLQYPFPTHPTLSTSATTPTTSTSSLSTPLSNAVASTSSAAPSLTTAATVASPNCHKPKTPCALGKSVSLQEVTATTSSPSSSSTSSATGNNNNSNNFNSNCNKSSTNNNNNVNHSNAEHPPSKLLMKSASLPNCGTSITQQNERSSLEKVDENKSLSTPVISKVEEVKPEAVVKKEIDANDKKIHSKDRRKNSEIDETIVSKEEHAKKDKDSSFRKEKEVKKSREPEIVEKKIDDKKSKSHKKSKDEHHHQHSVEEKKEEIIERAPSPNSLRKRRMSFEDVSSVDSSSEQTCHVEKSGDKSSKDSKHHDSKSNSKHHHHHNHKEKKSSSKEKTHCDDENQAKSKHNNDIASSKDSIFDELKRNSKDNIIKSSEKVHKSKKHHHHYHRENSTKDKENQTQVNNFNDTSSSVMTEDIRSSEDEVMRHNHNHKKDYSDHEKRSNHEKSRPESSEESSGKKKHPRRSLNNSLSTDDTDDSENGKNKISFFDIPDEAPNISMYDKVKARSCKNLKKQEEEKKIKDKFSALKQSRAKRERKRLNTSDDDTDSDMDGNSNDMFQMKFRKAQLSGSDEEDKDDESEMLRKAKIRNHLSVCDDESSESGITINDGHRKRSKFSSRKMSRTNVIDSSDDEMPTENDNENKHVEIKQEPNDFPSMPTSDFDDLKKHDESELRNFNNKHGSNGTKKRHHDKHKDDKSSKKSKKLSRDAHRKSTSSIDNNHKRDDKMDDIFGPISDEEIRTDSKNEFDPEMIEIKKEVIDIKPEPSEILSKEHHREESRKRKEKRRREREKQRAIKVEENSVDLDEAGRALEAQLMSDSEQQKSNNNELNKDVKSDDVFRFTDGDDEMKRDHHDAIKKKKKKKRAKEERKHHHNHHHYENSIKEEVVTNNLETSAPFNNNNNTKLRLDVITDDVDDVKPSVPLLMEEAPPKVIAPVEEVIVTPPVLVVKKEVKKPDVVIPGFGQSVDDTVHQKAVQSIEKELEKKPESIVEAPKAEKSPESMPLDNKAVKVDGEKTDEKSRVVISQEETEDAVAALLGESFCMAVEDEYNDPYDVPIVENDATGSDMIPPEEDEEMKNAIMSLNPDMDTKPETPQSEHELQIDTDNDDNNDDEEASSQPFDNPPPKTPDVDIAQKEVTPEREVAKPVQVKAEKKIEPPTIVAPKVETPKRIPSPKKEEAKAEKSPEKKEAPVIPRPVFPNFQSRLQPPTITIPQEQPISVEKVLSPRGSKQASPVIKTIAVPVVETPATVSVREPLTVSTSSQKMPSHVISPNSQTKPESPKINAITTKAEIKPILVHQPTVSVNSVQPPVALQKAPGNLSPYQVPNKEQKLNPITVAEKKINNLSPLPLKPGMTAAQQQILLQQAASRQPQIIYPPTTSGMIQTNFVKAEVKVEAVKEVKPEQWQQNVNSVIQKTDVMKEEPKIEKKSDVELSHEEDDYEDSSPDNSMEREGTKKVRGAGRQQRGRKAGVVQSPPAQEDSSSPSTRRGGKASAASKRGRGGRTASAKNTAVPSAAPIQTIMQSPAPPSGNVLLRQQKATGSDVYEFNDDSGEELTKGGDAQRPRLLMTIKSSTVATTVNTHPVITSPAPVAISTTVQTAPITASVVQPAILTQVATELPAELMIPPSPSNSQQMASPAHSDDFAQPNNTRKSRRLQEKDGTRTSVDDTIDDVIRNIAPPNQNQQSAKRTTRQHVIPGQPNTVVQASMPPHQQQALVNALNEVKKPVKSTKKQKDRKVSETSESETEKKSESLSTAITSTPQKSNIIQEAHSHLQSQPIQLTPIQPPQIPSMQIQKHPEMKMTSIPHLRESSELLQLIDPVTGELQKMTQSKEGQYVPVSEHHRLNAAKQLNLAAKSVQQAHVVEIKTDDKKLLAQTSVQNMVKVSSPVVIEPPKQPSAITTAEPTHVIKPVITQNPTYSKPPTLKTYVLSSQTIAKSQVVTTAAQTPSTTVISSQGMMKMNAPIVQHPSTIYNLPNIIPTNAGKYVAQASQPQKTVVMPAHQSQPTIIHQNPQQPIHQQGTQIVHQKVSSNGQQPQIVIHSQQHPLMHQPQPTNNLMINIPTSSASGQSVSSPRMHVKQVIQRTLPPQAPTQQIPSATTVVMKAGQPHHVVTTNQDPKSQPTYITQQGTKIVQGPPDGTPMSYINSGAREIIYVGGNVQKQTIYPNYPQSKYAPMPTPNQTKPQQIVQQIPSQSKIVEKVSTQPSVSVTHIQMPQSLQQQPQQKVYFTNSGQVITNVPTAPGHSEAAERHQQWIAHDKMPTQQGQPQPLKNRFIMDNYEEAHRAQIHVERVQQQAAQTQGQVKRSYVIEAPGQHQLSTTSQLHVPSSVVNQPIIPPQNKTVIGLNQAPQILTGAVASPPLKAHLTSQQPIVTGASSSRVAIPPSSPKDQLHPRHYPPEGYEEAVMRPPYMMTKIYHHQPPSQIYMRGGPEFARLPSRIEQREHSDIEERSGASPPLELRRTTAMPLQSPGDRITDSPMMAPLYLSPRIPQPYFYEGEGMKPLPATEPPPAHRTHAGTIPPTTVFAAQQAVLPPPTNLSHLQRERDHREKDDAHPIKDADGNVRYQIVYSAPPGIAAQSLVAPATNNRPIQLTTPPIASQVPLHADTLTRLLDRYPLMWQGLLALKTEQAAVQMHFVFGNKKIAKASLPFNSDHTTPPLRIAQRMRLEPSQIEGVARKMQITDEHCVLLALPCGFDYGDVLRQTENLQVSFINYLQQKQAAGIINIADPGSQNASYVVHIFPSCEFANESLERIAPDLMYKVANISHLLIVIATV